MLRCEQSQASELIKARPLLGEPLFDHRVERCGKYIDAGCAWNECFADDKAGSALNTEGGAFCPICSHAIIILFFLCYDLLFNFCTIHLREFGFDELVDGSCVAESLVTLRILCLQHCNTPIVVLRRIEIPNGRCIFT